MSFIAFSEYVIMRNRFLLTRIEANMQGNENSKILRVIALSELLSGGIVFFFFGQSHPIAIAAMILWGLAAYNFYRSCRIEE